jgi:putative ABC transport system permease protein
MEFGPILRAMFQNKTGAVLIALQIAVTMTVVVNAWVVIEDRLRQMERPSGIVEDALFHIQSRSFTPDYNDEVALADDLALLRGTPGVVDAVAINAIPLSGSGWSMALALEPGEDAQDYPVAVYMTDDHGLATLGVELLAGRDFEPGDVRDRGRATSDWPDTGIITQAMAKALWEDASPHEVVGRTVYINGREAITVIGVIARLQAPWNSWTDVEASLIVPDRTVWPAVRYLVRTEPGRRDELMPAVEEALARANLGRIVYAPESMAKTRERSYAIDNGVAKLLGVIMVALVAITALGIVGLASFSVRRRTKQIGTRRALGARRRDILRYFLLENLLITGAGVLLGAVLTIGFNVWLVDALNFPKIDWRYVPLGMIALLVTGVGAVIAPARQASTVSPAIATRTV